MKVIVLGGYGVFGARLVRLLCRDGHDVVIAGRSEASAQAFADEVGATALVVDRQGDLESLWTLSPDAVIDAAGPFHAYGDDPYALARACIAKGVHYLDLADDPAFCAGISVLDDQAQQAGVFVLSGVSSVPAISSAAVVALSVGALEIDTINSAILPGNRAPRGRSVVQSILHQTGQPFDVTIDGTNVPVRSWSRPAAFDLGQRITRKGWMIEVPDHRLFPAAFGARTVLFRAGLELGVMNHGLAVFAWLRGKVGFGISDWLVRLVLWAAKLLSPLGTDKGGMSVAVTARFADGWQRRTWRMVARAGEGPFIPAVAARIVLRDPGGIAPGARPAVGVVSLDAITAGMDDLGVTSDIRHEPLIPLFARFLGTDFDVLPQQVQDLHTVYGPRRWGGTASVTRGTTLIGRIIATVFAFPKAAKAVPATVTMTPVQNGEMWERQFGNDVFRSVLRQKGAHMTERFGPFTFTLNLHVRDGALHFPVLSGRMGALPLPRFMLPQSVAREYVENGKFHFDVALNAPITGTLIVRYRGTLERMATMEPRTPIS